MGSDTADPMAGSLNLLGAGAYVMQGLLSVVASIFGILSILVSSLPIIIIALIITTAMLPWVRYHDRAIEQAELGMRTVVFPLFKETVREFLNLFRRIYNPLICWWNAFNWWGYGMLREVLFPTIRACGVKQLLINVAYFIEAVAEDFVLHLASGAFWNSDADFSRVSATGIAMFQEWINLYACLCADLKQILGAVPFVSPILPFPPLWPLYLFSVEWLDAQTWCAIGNLFNALCAALAEFLRLVQQVLFLIFGQPLPGGVFIRPDLRRFINKLCPAVACFVRSTENAFQYVWDLYVPFKFTFNKYLCIVDALVCILLKTVGLLFRILINIDRCVVYPTDDFWESVIKADMIEIINLYVAPTDWADIRVPRTLSQPVRYTMKSYFLDTTSQHTKTGQPNPVFGALRLSECICTFITRTICDPSDESTGCFSQGAQNLLMGLDFCCATNIILKVLADVVTLLIEFSLHLSKGPDDFFLFIDHQPFTTVFKDDLTEVARCLFSIFGLIPVVGTCIRDLLVGVVRYLFCLADFGTRLVNGLLTLPYFLIVLPGIENFLYAANIAQDFFIKIHEDLIADVPGSIKNCLCVILNNAFPVPPIPCSSCKVTGFVPAPAFKRHRTFFDPVTKEMVNSPWSLMLEIWGESESIFQVTPLLSYGKNHTTNPITLFNRAFDNIQNGRVTGLPSLSSVDDLVNQKKEELKDRWFRVKSCKELHAEARELKVKNGAMYEYNLRRGKYDCREEESMMPPFNPSPAAGGSVSRRSAPAAGGGGTDFTDNSGATLAPHAGENATEKEARLTLGTTVPTLVGCTPPPPCFDLCCIVRSTLTLVVHLIQFITRFFNGIILGSASQQGTLQDYPYFTGEFANFGQHTFESDIVQLVLDLFVPIRCACQVLNLIIPVVPSAFSPGRPDICCFVQRISELLACIIMVIINAISALAMGDMPGASGFGYFTMGFFKSDVNTLFDISLEVVICLCVFVRAIFPLNFIPGFAEATNFDICCAGKVLLDTLIEIVRLVFQIVISLATITVDPSSYCYWRLDQTSDHMCGGTLDNIGFIKQLDVVINTFLPQSGESDKNGNGCLKNCGNDNGSSGIVPCICQILNTLVPYRRDPSKATNCLPKDDPNSNCQLLDLCCFFSKLGFTISDSLKFINRGFAALWQSWEGGLPEFFVNYVWCAEEKIAPCPEDQVIEPGECNKLINRRIPQCAGIRPILDSNSVVQFRCGEFTCGKLNIVIKDIADPFEGLFARCLCQLFGLLDSLIALIFNLIRIVFPFAGWSCCFCGGANPDGSCTINNTSPCPDPRQQGQIFNTGSGVLPAAAYIVQAALKAVVGLLRQFPLSCYWKPAGGRVPAIIRDTWIFSFLAPTADALCIASGNLMCFVNSMFLLPQVCQRFGSRFLGSVIRWVAEIILRVVGFIEAFVQSFISSPNTCVGPNCDQKAGSKEQTAKGVNAKPLGNMLVILLSIPTDLLIGDSDVACTTVCPSILAVPKPDACGCWNRSPAYANGVNITGPYFPDTGATNSSICLDPMTGEHVGARFGQTGGCCVISNPAAGSVLKSPLPICQSADDINVIVPTVNVTYNELYNITYVKPNFNYTGTNIQFETPLFPGSCVALGACRSDALPSCANDPETPIGLSAQYVGALDGLVMGFLKYLRCLLNNLLGCDSMGKNCTKLGIIFYPAILIFSISWQILGGVIRFIASIIIFLFSLFTPPQGDACSCWEQGVTDSWNKTAIQYYQQVGGLCYNCNILNHKCGVNIPVGSVANNPCSATYYPCAEYCPVNQQKLNPTFTRAQALQACLDVYANYTHFNSDLTAQQACSGHIQFLQACDIFATNATAQPCVNYFSPTVRQQSTGRGDDTNPNITFGGPASGGGANGGGLCNLYVPVGPTGGFAGDRRRFALPDACPDPHCQHNAPSQTICMQNVSGFWPCSGPGQIFQNSYPANPLVACGVLQIISNFLDIWTAFAEIFTTPLLIPAVGKRFVEELRSSRPSGAGRPQGPVNREPRQAFNKRMAARSAANGGSGFPSFSSPTRPEGGTGNKGVRFEGTVYGLDNSEGTNMVEATAEALFNYDVSDCYGDPVTCACRNFDISAHCSVNEYGEVVFGHKGRKRDGTNMTVNELNQMIGAELFTGETVCDHTIDQVATSNWAQLSEDRKNRYVACMDKKVQGSRLQQVADIFPDDIMYNSQAPMTLIHNVFHTVRTGLNKRHAVRQEQVMSGREEMEMRFPRFQEQLNQRMLYARQVLKEDYGITHESLIFDAAVRADQVWFKYETGFYNFALEKTLEGIASGRSIFPSPQEALTDVGHAAADLKNVILNQRYSHLYESSKEAVSVGARYTNELLDVGILESVKQGYARHIEYRKQRIGKRSDEQAEEAKRAFFASPLVKWWYDTPREQRFFTPFIDHMYRVVAFQREHWQTQPWNAFNADLKFWSLKDIFTTRFSKGPEWTPEKLQNIERAKRVYYQVQERIWPGSVQPNERERFLFLSNCVVLDKAVNLTLKVVDYCANEAMPNLVFTRRCRALEKQEASFDSRRGAAGAGESLKGIISYLRDVSPYRAESYYGYEHRSRFVEEQSVRGDEHSWIRPRLKTSFNATAYALGNVTLFSSAPPLRGGGAGVDARVYRANSHRSPAAMEVHGPANFNLFDWLIVTMEDIFGFALGAEADTWFDAIKNWFLNDKTDVKQWPASNGLKFFIFYLPSCPFPEGTNCSIGIGFEYAFYWVSLGAIGLFIIGAFIFPPIMIPFTFISFGLAYIAVLFMVAWFFPPGCFTTFPFPSLPSCAYDQLMAFLDKWITNCYSPLIIPNYMIAGPVCPTDPTQSIDVINCRDIGVSDGIQNLLYAGYWILGQPFCDFMIYISSTTIGMIIPGMQAYIATTLNDFKTSSDTNKQRLTFCFWATLPTILFPLTIVFLGGIVLALIVPPLLLLINALITFFMASPAAVVVPGADASVWYGEAAPSSSPSGEEDEEDDYDSKPDVKTDASFRGVINRAIYGKIKVE